MRVLVVEDEPYMAEAIRDGLRLEAMAAESPLLLTRTEGPSSFIRDARVLWVERDDDAMLAARLIEMQSRGWQRYGYDLRAFSHERAAGEVEALYRRNDYARAGVPMLPVTHGVLHTRRQILLYTVGLVAISALPFITGMSGLLYLAAALSLGTVFMGHATALWRRYSDELARATFRYSIAYLALLFAALLVDHYM